MGFSRGEIYRIWFDNDESGRCYIGQTVQGSLIRVKQHIDDAKTKEGGCPKLDAATRKFGTKHMHYEVLESGIETYQELDEAERFWIEKYDSVDHGYNVKIGGQRTAHFDPTSDNLTDTILPIPSWARRGICDFFGVPREIRRILF